MTRNFDDIQQVLQAIHLEAKQEKNIFESSDHEQKQLFANCFLSEDYIDLKKYVKYIKDIILSKKLFIEDIKNEFLLFIQKEGLTTKLLDNRNYTTYAYESDVLKAFAYNLSKVFSIDFSIVINTLKEFERKVNFLEKTNIDLKNYKN